MSTNSCMLQLSIPTHICKHIFVCSLSALDEPSEDGESPDVAEMPIDLDIEVESVGLDENEIEQLRQDTR